MQFKCIKTVNANHRLILFNPLIGPLSGATTQGQSGPGSHGNQGVLCIPQSSSIAGTSPSDCLMPYPGHSLVVGGSYLSAEMLSVYSIAPADWAIEKWKTRWNKRAESRVDYSKKRINVSSRVYFIL